VHRILLNLLDNAVKYGPAGQTVRVSLTTEPRGVVLKVRDEGPGVPAEAGEKGFERFHSVRPDGEDFGSHSGLGLAIARTIADAHEGALVAIDRPDGKPGACLQLTLPETAR